MFVDACITWVLYIFKDVCCVVSCLKAFFVQPSFFTFKLITCGSFWLVVLNQLTNRVLTAGSRSFQRRTVVVSLRTWRTFKFTSRITRIMTLKTVRIMISFILLFYYYFIIDQSFILFIQKVIVILHFFSNPYQLGFVSIDLLPINWIPFFYGTYY